MKGAAVAGKNFGPMALSGGAHGLEDRRTHACRFNILIIHTLSNVAAALPNLPAACYIPHLGLGLLLRFYMSITPLKSRLV